MVTDERYDAFGEGRHYMEWHTVYGIYKKSKSKNHAKKEQQICKRLDSPLKYMV
jgi:hypothetical protein